MKNKKGIFKVLLILLMICVLLPMGADVDVYAQGKAPKWTATTAKKEYSYTGSRVKPKVTVKYQGKRLTSQNYKLTYSKNPIKPGTYKIKVTLKGKYKGKKLAGSKYIKYSIIIPRVKSLKKEYYNDKYSCGCLYFSWEPNLKADGYNIEVRNNGTLGKRVEKIKLGRTYGCRYVDVSEYGVKYTFRIRSYKKIGKKIYYSKWSTISANVPIPDYNMTTKTVNGIDVAYNKDEFTFFKYISTDSDGNAKKKFAQCYFPIFIKQKINDDFVIHTQYNGKCGFNNFSHTQYIPNRKNAQVVTDISVTYYDKIPAGDKMQQALYKKGYIGYILVNVSCLLNKQQSVGVYFGDKKVLTLVSNGFSKASGYDYDKYWNYDPFLSSAYSYRHETALKKILKDVSRCAPDMTDYETYTALKYWIRSHSYSEYTCWGASTVGEAMTELGYAYTPLFCSYIKNNEIYNDYSKYYSTQSKQSHCALGHMVTLIYMKKGKYLFCEVQGSLYSDAEFKFDPKGWSKPTNSLSHALSPASDEFPLNEYTTIEDMMKGDYGINVNTYDPFNWHTWMPGLN